MPSTKCFKNFFYTSVMFSYIVLLSVDLSCCVMPSVQLVPRLFLEVKRPGRGADHPPPTFSAKVENG
jgi:hypothetical protein